MKKSNKNRGKKYSYDEDAPKMKFEKNQKRKKNKTILKDVAKGTVDYYDYIHQMEDYEQ